ncbi:uncharacterized protein CTRU02_214136 [Colletotrichum truncatum]|uniref:Uncharacterized protein n=1 Tax=Colletotrichum truncatum TaxID=5467 RepID=A0ACC3YI85_COLTU|nr:uncharacterized protein CTRU02_06446 [Colletotrichum truncatum]KAF6792950.1 hypothetical protein CTRU02_06446 [Colletotrichum truncatum]
MTTSKRDGPHHRWVRLLFLASTSTAAIISVGGTSLTLSNFQLITQLSVPLGCLLTYNNPIQGCTASDFASGAICSKSCILGLARMQDNLRDTCQSSQVPVNTLLGQALAGNLVNLLCPNTKQTSAAPTLKPTSTVIVVPPVTTVIPPVPPPPPPPPATTTPKVIPPPVTTPAPVPPPSQPPVLPPPSTIVPPLSQPPPPPLPPPAPVPTTIATSTTTNDAAPQTTSAETAKPPINPLDALLLNDGTDRKSKIERWLLYSLCVLSVLIGAWAS